MLVSKGLKAPSSVISNNSLMYKDLLKRFDGEEIVVKLVNGTHGIGVLLADNHRQAESIMEAFNKGKQQAMMQEFIRESKGTDIRVFVVDGEIVGCMKRQARPGEFRSNLHRGGRAKQVRITPEERSTAVRSAKIMGLRVAGVDMLRSNHGPVVMEVNSSPGLEGIEGATNLDIAGMIIEFLEKNAKPGKTKTKGKG